MRKVPIFFALMLIGAAFASPAQADGQCEALAVAAFKNDSGRVAALIASGVSVNCSFSGSYVTITGKTVTYTTTPLNSQINPGYGANLNAVRLLLSHGANVNLKDGDGYTPLDNIRTHIMELVFLDGSDEELKEADEVRRLIMQAGGVESEKWKKEL